MQAPGEKPPSRIIGFDALSDPEGSLLLIDATTAPYVHKYQSVEKFLESPYQETRDVDIATITGVGDGHVPNQPLAIGLGQSQGVDGIRRGPHRGALVSLFVGSHILRFFGISMPALRIAGGLVVAVTGWTMLHAAPVTPGHATSTADFATMQRMAFFPMTIPLTTGPGTIATAIALGTNRANDLDGLCYASIVSLVVALAVTATIYHAYTRSSAMARLAGEEGTSVVTKLSAFLLLCIGVEIVITGVVEVARSLMAGSA